MRKYTLITLFCFCTAPFLSAQEPLVVEGAIVIQDTTSSPVLDGTIQFEGTEFQGRVAGAWKPFALGSPSLWVNDADNLYYSVAGGYVGIGVADPLARLHVKYRSEADRPLLRLTELDLGDVGQIRLENQNSSYFSIRYRLGGGDEPWMGWYTNEDPNLIYNPLRGALGLHKTDPLGTMQIHEPVRDTALLVMSPASSNQDSRIMLAEGPGGAVGMILHYDGGLNQFHIIGADNGGELDPAMRVKRTGEIALGQSFATGYKLSVDGKIMCEELQVMLEADWPDYVFESDYDLRPLSEVREYIDEHGHLPDVPAASEIEESGVPVGEMQRILLQKIEELTLYVIELSEENEELKSVLKAKN